MRQMLCYIYTKRDLFKSIVNAVFLQNSYIRSVKKLEVLFANVNLFVLVTCIFLNSCEVQGSWVVVPDKSGSFSA